MTVLGMRISAKPLICAIAVSLLSVAIASAQDGSEAFIGANGRTSLNNSLTAYWNLKEASGTRVDSVAGTYNLTATNTPGNTAGKVGNAVTLVSASSQYLTGASYNPSGDFSMVCWSYRTSNSGIETILAITGTTGADIEYRTTGGAYRFVVGGSALASTFGATSLSTYYMIAARYTNATKGMELSVNAGAWNTATAAANPTSGAVMIGANATPTNFYNGQIDECGLWSRLLTDPEVSYEFNSGTGRTLFSLIQDFWFHGIRYAMVPMLHRVGA